MLYNKRASLEISIQAIVIVVLAMTLLGLGLGFIRSMFKGISGVQEQVTEDVRAKIGRQLIETDEKLAFPRSEISIKRGDSAIIEVGINNKGNSPLDYKMFFEVISSSPPNLPRLSDSINWLQYSADKTYTLPAADFDVRQIRISVPKNADQGSYFFNFDILQSPFNPIDSASIYAQKDFFIVVTG